MRLEQLQAFLAVAETGNFQQAAQKCGVSQSTVSRQVQSLEASVGLLLFHRQGSAKLTLGAIAFCTMLKRFVKSGLPQNKN